MEVISLEKGKVEIGDNKVYKRSSIFEYNNLLKARQMCKNYDNIYVPEVYSFKDNIICMERVYGENLEILLRTKETHEVGVKYVNYLINYMIENCLFWHDFAPRNILVNSKGFMIFDFERGITSKKMDVKEYLSNSVYEEYSAFLLPNERIFDVDYVFDTNKNEDVLISSISSTRVKMILNILGYSEKVAYDKYLLAIKMIVLNETPYINNGNYYFPLLDLEEYIEKNGREKYAERIINDYEKRVRKI